MGLYVDMRVDVRIPKDKQADCLKAINMLHIADVLKENAGGGSDNNPHYSWVNNPGVNGFPTLEDALYAWRYECKEVDGVLTIFAFIGEKWGDDEVLYKALASFAEDGSSIEVEGGGETWGYTYKNGVCVTQTAETKWKDGDPL